MTYEFKEIIRAYKKSKQEGKNVVLATVVKVEGSSYRRPGVQMLIQEDGTTVGAVSGGCVEKEVCRQSITVFNAGIPKIMTYDGRFRLGCEGILYILLERMFLDTSDIDKIEQKLEARLPFYVQSNFSTEPESHQIMGTHIDFGMEKIWLSTGNALPNAPEHIRILVKPSFRLVIIGAEHDAVKLCQLSSFTGWEVIVIAPPNEMKKAADFPGIKEIRYENPEEFEGSVLIDPETAVVLMTHNFARDLLYLKSIVMSSPLYIGLLGPAKRREKILNALIDYFPEVTEGFLQKIYGPAGLNIGAETPQEIAVSILSEILAVAREQDPMHLQDKVGAIHSFTEPVTIQPCDPSKL